MEKHKFKVTWMEDPSEVLFTGTWGECEAFIERDYHAIPLQPAADADYCDVMNNKTQYAIDGIPYGCAAGLPGELLQTFANHGLEVDFRVGLECEHNGFVLHCEWDWFVYCSNRKRSLVGEELRKAQVESPPLTSDFQLRIADEKYNAIPLTALDETVLGYVPWECLDDILRAFKAKEWDKMEDIVLKAVK